MTLLNQFLIVEIKTMKMLSFFIAAFTTLIGLSESLASVNMVSNPGFETADFTGWTKYGEEPMEISDSYIYVHRGHYGAQLGSTPGLGYLEQDIATTPGQNYFISFWLAPNFGAPNAFSVSFGGNTLLSLVDYPDTGIFQFYSFEAKAVGSSSRLQFAIMQDWGYQGLDDVWVATQVSGVPEPATWLMMLIGFGGLGAAMRKMRRRANPAQA
jgi:hypothetical protein